LITSCWWRGGFELFTDHRNLTYLYNPEAAGTVMKHTQEKLARWGVILRGFRYRIHHVSGEDNVWADLLSRWGSSHQEVWERDVAAARDYAPVYDAHGNLIQGAAPLQASQLPPVGKLPPLRKGEVDSSGIRVVDTCAATAKGRRTGVQADAASMKPGGGEQLVTELGSAFMASHPIPSEVEAVVHKVNVDSLDVDLFSPNGFLQVVEEAQEPPKRATLVAATTFYDLLPNPVYDVPEAVLVTKETVSARTKGYEGLRVVLPKDGGQPIIWVPPVDALRLRLAVIAHGGPAGHRGSAVAVGVLREDFTWLRMAKDVERFCRKCLHCVPTHGGLRVPRALGTQAHASRPNEMLHFDFLQMETEAEDAEEMKYVLVIKDDFSGFVELVPSKSATAEVVVEALLAWFKRFGVVTKWVSDQGTHFTAAVMRELGKELGVSHHYTVAYSPWANGTVERVNRDLLQVMRALRVERPLVLWKKLLPVV
jgi:hypothetical protein